MYGYTGSEETQYTGDGGERPTSARPGEPEGRKGRENVREERHRTLHSSLNCQDPSLRYCHTVPFDVIFHRELWSAPDTGTLRQRPGSSLALRLASFATGTHSFSRVLCKSRVRDITTAHECAKTGLVYHTGRRTVSGRSARKPTRIGLLALGTSEQCDPSPRNGTMESTRIGSITSDGLRDSPVFKLISVSPVRHLEVKIHAQQTLTPRNTASERAGSFSDKTLFG